MQILINIIVQKFNSIESIVFLQHIGWLCDNLLYLFQVLQVLMMELKEIRLTDLFECCAR